jgi:hypothetical protein
MPPKHRPPTGEARRLARQRAPRFKTDRELRRAVLDWCREWIRGQNPGCDLARIEKDLARWAAPITALDDEAFEQWCALRDALKKAAKFLEANPAAPEQSAYAAAIEGFFSAACAGNNGKFDKSIGERLNQWPHTSHKDRWPLGSSPRARIVAMFENLSGTILWWSGQRPSPRDLAVITLLAGQWPEAARKLQAGPTGAGRPTVLGVVRAEENAVRATLSAKKRRKSR